MVVGIALGILSVVMVTLPLLRLVKDAPLVTTPGSVTLHLGKSLYKVFEPTGTATGAVPGSSTPSVTAIHAADVNVTGAGGGGIPVSDTGPSENITRGNRRYASAVAFRVSTPGDYTVRITGARGEALIVRSLADAVRSRVGWVAAIPIGGLCFLTGLVLLIVGIVRRNRA
jgi:regulator of protease activity HflC (stomatin/prohibitin superfamily)